MVFMYIYNIISYHIILYYVAHSTVLVLMSDYIHTHYIIVLVCFFFLCNVLFNSVRVLIFHCAHHKIWGASTALCQKWYSFHYQKRAVEYHVMCLSAHQLPHSSTQVILFSSCCIIGTNYSVLHQKKNEQAVTNWST